MSGKSNGFKLYNLLFPFWMLMLLPQLWLIVLPGNFIIDSLVLLVSMFILKVENKTEVEEEVEGNAQEEIIKEE